MTAQEREIMQAAAQSLRERAENAGTWTVRELLIQSAERIEKQLDQKPEKPS